MFETLKTCWIVLRADNRGVTAVEYAVIAGVLVAAIGTAFTTLGTTLKTFFAGFTFT
ncbi:MAG TPA: Flp family type IVb pilin [Acetobacteraceae bacterium]|nr:Flp family type IVb pilin [Acetobacteraceae bacterium]